MIIIKIYISTHYNFFFDLDKLSNSFKYFLLLVTGFSTKILNPESKHFLAMEK